MNAPQKKEKLVRVTTPAGFLSYPKLDKPGETKFDLGFYHADLFISAEDMGSDDGKNFQLKMIEVARKFTGHPTLTLREPNFKPETVAADGVTKIPGKDFYFPVQNTRKYTTEEFAKLPDVIKEGNFFLISAKNKFAPSLVGRDGKTKLTPEQVAGLRGGERVRFQIDLNPYEMNTNQVSLTGVSFRLIGVQYLDVGTPFGGSVTFESIEIKPGDMTNEVGLM
jgi:hypothetical protein